VQISNPAGPRSEILAFDEFVLDESRATFSRAGVAGPLRPKAFALLLHLARNAGRVLSKAELLAHVWPNVVVGDDSLSQCINEVRAALGERGPALIRTVARRGYRFDAVVESRTPATMAVQPRPSAGWARRAAACGAALLLLLVGAADVRVPHTTPGIDVELANRRSLALMPFANLDEPPTPYLAEGITQEILIDLGRLPDALIVASAAVRTIQDLKGRKVAFQPLSPSDFLLGYALAQRGLTKKDLQPVNVTPEAVLATMATGLVDAGVTYQPSVSMILELGGGTRYHVLLSSREARGMITDVVPAEKVVETARAAAAQLTTLDTRAYALSKQRLRAMIVRWAEERVEQELVALPGPR